MLGLRVIYIYIRSVGPVPPPCSAPHSNLFQFTFILNRGLDCEPRLLFTGSQDTFVSFHLREGGAYVLSAS